MHSWLIMATSLFSYLVSMDIKASRGNLHNLESLGLKVHCLKTQGDNLHLYNLHFFQTYLSKNIGVSK